MLLLALAGLAVPFRDFNSDTLVPGVSATGISLGAVPSLTAAVDPRLAADTTNSGRTTLMSESATGTQLNDPDQQAAKSDATHDDHVNLNTSPGSQSPLSADVDHKPPNFRYHNKAELIWLAWKKLLGIVDHHEPNTARLHDIVQPL